MKGPVSVHRFSFAERLVHWVVGVGFVVLLLSGLAFSHPSVFWLTGLLGGGPSARVLHPIIGVIYSVALLAMILLWMRDMRLEQSEVKWLKSVRHYATHDKDNVPPVGKYNPGQKLFFWIMAAIGIAHLVSGIPMWFPRGALGVGAFTAGAVNAMRLVHYVTTVGGGLLLIVHVYLGTLAFPGTARGMLHGSVSQAWARHHHPLWNAEPAEGVEAGSKTKVIPPA